MSQGQRKVVGAIIVAASVAAAIGGYIGMKEGVRRRNARQAKLTATAGWGLDAATRDRIFDALERDMKPVLDTPRFKDYQKQQLAAARARGVKTADVGFSKELGRMLVARGIPRLPDADMNALHELKKKMVFASKRVCPCLWDPATCTEADVMDGLARLSPPDMDSWSRLSAQAALAELTAASAAPDTRSDFQQGLVAVSERLPRNRRQRFDAILGGAGSAASPSKADQCFAMQTIFSGADAMPLAERIRFARALANAGVDR